MNPKKLHNLFGLKWNPFSPELPIEGLHVPAAVSDFLWRIEHCLVREGGFAAIDGEPGSGKSVTLRLLAERLAGLPELKVAILTHPSCHLADFYREMGEAFGVPLQPHNRWCGFKALRQLWQEHLEQLRLRPVLLIDEAQELPTTVLAELRLLASACFDSRLLLTVVLAGDNKLSERLASPELRPLASRLRTRLHFQPLPSEHLREFLEHLLRAAGNAGLMSEGLITTLCQHCTGNPRALTILSNELLTAAVQRELTQLDEKLFLELVGNPASRAGKASRPTTKR